MPKAWQAIWSCHNSVRSLYCESSHRQYVNEGEVCVPQKTLFIQIAGRPCGLLVAAPALTIPPPLTPQKHGQENTLQARLRNKGEQTSIQLSQIRFWAGLPLKACEVLIDGRLAVSCRWPLTGT